MKETISNISCEFPSVSSTPTFRQVELQTRDRFGNAIEVSYGDIFKGLLYGQPQVGSDLWSEIDEWEKKIG